MDRYVVACYDSAVAAHFHRHRDNINAGAQHRRFALSINLNKDFDGGDLVFPGIRYQGLPAVRKAARWCFPAARCIR